MNAEQDQEAEPIPKNVRNEILGRAPEKLVPQEVLRRVTYGVILAYGLDLTFAGLLLSFWSAAGEDFSAIAFLAGHGLALAVGLSWIVGTILSANRSINAKMASTLVLTPLRYFGGIMILVGFAAYLEETKLIGILAFSFMFTQIFNHLLQGFITLSLKGKAVTIPEEQTKSEKGDPKGPPS